jgi:hypothetical protein
MDRVDLRLADDTFAAIDAACAARPGKVSRNTWIAESVEEKPARERNALAPQNGERRVHG